jgi:hypothetical protein
MHNLHLHTHINPYPSNVVNIVSSWQYSNIRVYPSRCNVTQFIYIWKLLYMFPVVLPPIIGSAYNCIYSIWYLSQHRYFYLPLSWKSWNRFECAVGGVLSIMSVQNIQSVMFVKTIQSVIFALTIIKISISDLYRCLSAYFSLDFQWCAIE